MNTVTETCPPLEDIAAFLDGKLSEGERARIVAHLADCEACYAVFAGAARFQLEEEGEEEELPMPEAAEAAAPVVPFPRRTIPRWAFPLAAALVLGLTSIPLYLQASRMPEMLSTELVDPAALKNVPTASVWNEDKRGVPESTALDTSPFEFLVGVHVVDLRFTLARGDLEETKNVLSRINGHMEALLFVHEQAAFYEKAVGDLDEGRRTLSEVAEEAARVEADLTEAYSDFPHLAFGKWTEAGRLSALAGNAPFFEDGDNRRFPGWLLKNAQDDLDEEVVPTLKRIRGIIEDSDPSKLPHEDLAKQFKAILDHYQREVDAASSD
jgi:Putative zinc-finger